MSRLPVRLALGLTLLLGGCAQSAGRTDGGGSRGRGLGKARVQLPDPLPLPEHPPAVFVVDAPAEGLAVLAPWTQVLRSIPLPDQAPAQAHEARAGIPENLDAAGVLRQQFEFMTTPQWAATLSTAIDPQAPWSVVRLDGAQGSDEIAHFSISKPAMRELSRSMGELESRGDFGAVVLPPRVYQSSPDAPGRPGTARLAWLDARAGTLTLAKTERGLATGSAVRPFYGKTPIVFAMDLPSSEQLPLERVQVRGSIDALDVTVAFADGFALEDRLPIMPGTLGGLMDDPALVVGATGRYKDYESQVKKIVTRVNRSVSEQPFLVRGLLEDLASKGNAAIRTWDGRAAAGVGPDGHLHIAYGAADPKKSGLAVLRFLRTLKDNTDLLGKFAGNIPSLALKKSVGEAAGNPVHRFRISGARKQMPEELEHLLDKKGRLSIAMAWSEHAGAGMMVVGPNCVKQLERWLKAAQAAPGSDKAANALAGATLHASPADLARVLQAKFPEEEVFTLQPGGDKHTIVAKRGPGNTYLFHITRTTPTAP